MKALPVSPVAALLVVWLVTAGAASARAQTLPAEPLAFGGGRVTVGGDVSVTTSCAHADTPDAPACADDAGFFNYTDYEHSAIRTFRVDLLGSVRANAHLSVLGEIRSENADRPQPYALYARITPWTGRDIDIQVGRVPPVFGAFARRTYAADNLLIGYPLAYQYLTSLRPDALPANADELVRMRGRGWLSSFSVGDLTAAHGVPLASAFRWDTGVELHGATPLVDATIAVTVGTLANPLVRDDNSGKQVAGRVALTPIQGLVLGMSAARGAFVGRDAAAAAGAPGGDFPQTSWGGDVEYSRGYYLVRAETIISGWTLPLVQAPLLRRPLRAVGTSIEGRYRIHPRVSVAARLDHLGFSDITSSFGTTTWDAPVTRVEAGGTYALQRNLQLKLSVQHNTRDGGRAAQVDVAAAQLVFWF